MSQLVRRAQKAAPLAWLIALALLAGMACASEESAAPTAPVTIPAATATPAGPAATATADPAVLLKDGGIAIIEIAYKRLLDQYIDPLDSAALLRSAYAGASGVSPAHGNGAPAFTGDRVGDFAAFRAAYVRLVDGLPETGAKEIRFAAIRAMAQSLQDCHTFFLTPVASETLVDTRAGKGSVGIGIELAGVPPLITEVIEGGPAERAGVLVGDRVASIDGADAGALGPAGAFELINGEEGTTVSLQLRRPNVASPLALTLRRERVVPPNVTSRVLDSGIGYVRVRNFVSGGVSEKLETALSGFEARGVTAWIIDLRDNPGGELDPDAISLFVREGVIVRARGRDGVNDEYAATGEVLPQLRPTVVLTNDRTGSVSEVFAAALQEYGVAKIVGAKTNGCAGYTDVQPLGDGSSLAVTTHENVGPVTSRPLTAGGVVPDIAATRTQADIVAGRDPQLDAAVTALR